MPDQVLHDALVLRREAMQVLHAEDHPLVVEDRIDETFEGPDRLLALLDAKTGLLLEQLAGEVGGRLEHGLERGGGGAIGDRQHLLKRRSKMFDHLPAKCVITVIRLGTDGANRYPGMMMPMVLRPVLFTTTDTDAKGKERDYLVVGWTSTSPERRLTAPTAC